MTAECSVINGTPVPPLTTLPQSQGTSPKEGQQEYVRHGEGVEEVWTLISECDLGAVLVNPHTLYYLYRIYTRLGRPTLCHMGSHPEELSAVND